MESTTIQQDLRHFNHTKQALCEDIYGVKTAKRFIQLESKFYWLKIADDGIVELYLDNHMMQTFRACEASFIESFVNQRGSINPVWFLSLGSAVHKMIEIYYIYRKHPAFTLNKWAIECGVKVWNSLNMNQFKEREEYHLLGGVHGFVGLLLQYAETFNRDNERFRVIGTELYFGKAKEVPLLDGKPEDYLPDDIPFRLFLSGKIDLLIDDGESICPMDHKTSKDFRGQNPMIGYEIQEGMTGYVYAARKILARYNESCLQGDARAIVSRIGRKPANKIWMNFLQIKVTGKDQKPSDRFKRAPLFKTEQQLEDYRLRQIRTASKILNLISNPDAVPDYNTMMCNNWMHGQCGFHPLHRLDSTVQDTIAASTFVQIEPWNPEKQTKEDILIGDINDIFQSTIGQVKAN